MFHLSPLFAPLCYALLLTRASCFPNSRIRYSQSQQRCSTDHAQQRHHFPLSASRQEDSVSSVNTIAKTSFPKNSVRREYLRSKVKQLWTKRVFCNFLYFSTGFENVRAIQLYGKLVSMCTGNTVRTVTAVAEGRFRDAVSPGGLVVWYLVGVALSRSIHSRLMRDDTLTSRSAVTTTFVENVTVNGAVNMTSVTSRSLLGRFSRAIVPSIVLLYGLADVFIDIPTLSAWMQACAYGLLYTTAQVLVGGSMIFFAVTGHCTVFANSAVDAVVDKNEAARKRVWERAEYLLSFMVGVWFAVKAWDVLLVSSPKPIANMLQGHAWKGLWYAMAFLGVQYSV